MNLVRWVTVWLLDRAVVLRLNLRYLFSPAVPAAYSVGELPPVLLVHGAYENWRFLRPVGDRLNRLGHPVYVVRELGHNRGPLLPSAAIVSRFLVAHDVRRVIIVGHSKGGIIGKQLMVTDAVAGRVDRVVAINSPFSGSRLASFALGATLRAFVPTDPTLGELAQKLEANSHIVSIFSRFDPVILEGCRLESARNIELPLSGHFRPLVQAALSDAVVRAVEDSQGTE